MGRGPPNKKLVSRFKWFLLADDWDDLFHIKKIFWKFLTFCQQNFVGTIFILKNKVDGLLWTICNIHLYVY